MADSPKVYRDALCRLHRSIAHYFAVRAWVNKAECVVLDRSVLETLLGLERIKRVRVDWIKQDVKLFFPYMIAYYTVSQGRPLATLFLSRVEIKRHIPGTMPTARRIALLESSGVKVVHFNDRTVFKDPEKTLLRESVLWATGFSLPAK